MFSLLYGFYNQFFDQINEIEELKAKIIYNTQTFLDELATRNIKISFDTDNISFNDEYGTSETINKKNIMLYLRNINNEIESFENLMFTIIHLLAFMMNDSFMHGNPWQENFGKLLTIYNTKFDTNYDIWFRIN